MKSHISSYGYIVNKHLLIIIIIIVITYIIIIIVIGSRTPFRSKLEQSLDCKINVASADI